jgi:cytochrome c oxidase subunit IV
MAIAGERAKKLVDLIDRRAATAQAAQDAHESEWRRQLAILLKRQADLKENLQAAIGGKWEEWDVHPELTGGLGDEIVGLESDLAALTDVLGPPDPRNIMAHKFAQNSAIVGLAIYLILGTLASAASAWLYWDTATAGPDDDKQSEEANGSGGAAGTGMADAGGTTAVVVGPDGAAGTPAAAAVAPRQETGKKPDRKPEKHGRQERPIFLMVLIMGLLGGFLRAMSSLVKYVGNGQLLTRWVLYYVLMPLEGMAVAVVMYLTVRIGLLAATTNLTSTDHLNVVAIYTFAVMAGLFSKQALENFSQLFDTLFRSVKAKDPLRDGAAASPPRPTSVVVTVQKESPTESSTDSSAAPGSPPDSPPKSP